MGFKSFLSTAVVATLLAHPCVVLANPIPPEERVDVVQLTIDRKQKLASDRYRLRSRISRYLGAAMEELDEGNAEEAGALLAKLNPKRLNPHERAKVFYFQGHVAYNLANYDDTIAYFEKALAQEAMQVDEETRIRFAIAQLHAASQDWQAVIDSLLRWFRYSPEPDPTAYYLLAIAYFQMENFDEAIRFAEIAVDNSPEPREGWLQLLAALYIQNQDYANATPVLEELVVRFPKKDYWVRLSLIYGARDDFRGSLAVQQVAYLQGLLTEDKELRRLARSYLYHELPYQAAKVLEKGIADGHVASDVDSQEMLANAWIAAREYDRSLAPLQQAARLSDSGDLYIRLGQVHMQREEWSEAAELFQQAIRKGGLEDPGNAELLLGISYYNAESVDRARAYFSRARKHESTRAQADNWLTHIEREARAAG